jgi:hypothetical protein
MGKMAELLLKFSHKMTSVMLQGLKAHMEQYVAPTVNNFERKYNAHTRISFIMYF